MLGASRRDGKHWSGTIFENDDKSSQRIHHGIVSCKYLELLSQHLTIYCRIPKSSYYDAHYKQSAALIRARRPYLIRNTLTGLGLFGFCIGVCKDSADQRGMAVLMVLADSFTIRAVSQDDFDDVIVPDAPAQSPRAGASTMASPVAAK